MAVKKLNLKTDIYRVQFYRRPDGKLVSMYGFDFNLLVDVTFTIPNGLFPYTHTLIFKNGKLISSWKATGNTYGETVYSTHWLKAAIDYGDSCGFRELGMGFPFSR